MGDLERRRSDGGDHAQIIDCKARQEHGREGGRGPHTWMDENDYLTFSFMPSERESERELERAINTHTTYTHIHSIIHAKG